MKKEIPISISNSASSQLDKPVIRGIVNGGSGKLIVRVKKVKITKVYQARHREVAANGQLGPEQDGGLHGNSRSIENVGLTPGVNYQIEIRAVSGTAGNSEWSDPGQHRSL